MLQRGTSDELRATAERLLELAKHGASLARQLALIRELGESRRLVAMRPLVHVWAYAASSAHTTDVGVEALLALAELWSICGAHQLNQIDQQLRAHESFWQTSWSAWRRLTPESSLAALPSAGPHRVAGLRALACHPSGHVRELALRELVGESLDDALPMLLVRANDWVRQVRSFAQTHLLALDTNDVTYLAPLLESVEALESRGRRDAATANHLLNTLRTEPGLAAVQLQWSAASPSLRRAAFRFSWDAAPARDAIVEAASRSLDPVLRRWAVGWVDRSDTPGAHELLRRLASDRVPMVAEASLDALDRRVVASDRALLEALRCASSPSVQLTARYLLQKHFGEAAHRQVYLDLLDGADDRTAIAAANGLAACGEASDHARLLDARLRAGARARRRLLGAAATLDFEGARAAILEDLGSALPGVSKCARNLMVDRARDPDMGAVARLMTSPHTHVRMNALVVAGRPGSWSGLPLLLRAHTDPEPDVATLAQQRLAAWFEPPARVRYWAARPSREQEAMVRSALAGCATAIGDARQWIERALAGE